MHLRALDSMEHHRVGMGIHGEPGRQQIPLPSEACSTVQCILHHFIVKLNDIDLLIPSIYDNAYYNGAMTKCQRA